MSSVEVNNSTLIPPDKEVSSFVARLFTWLGLLFFLLMLVLPTTYQMQRGVLLAILLLGVTVRCFYKRWRLHKAIFFWGLLTITASLSFIAIGVINNAPGALSVMTVYVVWPMVFLYFMGALSAYEQMHAFLKVIIVGTIIAAMMAMSLLLEYFFNINLGIGLLLQVQGAALGIHDGFLEFRLYNMNTVIYALPFLLAILFMPHAWSPCKGGWRTAAWVALALSVLTLVISGRRGFWLIAAMSPFIVVGLLWLSGIRAHLSGLIIKVGVIILLVSITSVILLDVDFQVIWTDFAQGFEFANADNPSAFRRREQLLHLLDGWAENPLLGAGHGASADVGMSDRLQPWAYELSYVALLFQTGIIGILIYGSAVAWVYIMGLRMIRRSPEAASLLIPTLAGLTGFLIVNITNPYLLKFDYLWTLFLPIAVLNSFLLRNPRLTSSSSTGTRAHYSATV
jgi:hypothetical protein